MQIFACTNILNKVVHGLPMHNCTTTVIQLTTALHDPSQWKPQIHVLQIDDHSTQRAQTPWHAIPNSARSSLDSLLRPITSCPFLHDSTCTTQPNIWHNTLKWSTWHSLTTKGQGYMTRLFAQTTWPAWPTYSPNTTYMTQPFTQTIQLARPAHSPKRHDMHDPHVYSNNTACSTSPELCCTHDLSFVHLIHSPSRLIPNSPSFTSNHLKNFLDAQMNDNLYLHISFTTHSFL